jgi:propanediol dehydratase small subunit
MKMPVAKHADHMTVLTFSIATASSKCGIISPSYRCYRLVSLHPEMKVAAKTATLTTMTVSEMLAPRICPVLRRLSTSAVIMFASLSAAMAKRRAQLHKLRSDV